MEYYAVHTTVNDTLLYLNSNLHQMEKYRRVEFEAASRPSTGFGYGVDSMKDRSVHLKENNSKKNIKTDGLFPDATVKNNLKWKRMTSVGPGLYNHGNTCYLNSALQCLIHTPALAQIFLNKGGELDGLLKCHQKLVVMNQLRSVIVHAWSANDSNKKVISPTSIVHNIRLVARNFRPGRQEDAHEFIVQLLDKIHESMLKLHNIKLNDKLANTTAISRIFGGAFRNELKCCQCGYKSHTFNSFMDLSLDITKGISSVSSAVAAFSKPEVLDRGNEWKCEKCNKKVRAVKQMVISKAPNVLMLHLKRFNYNGKINKHIDFQMELNLPCIENEKNTKIRYHLTGIVVHHGHSTHSGHYVAYVKAPNDTWCEMNDSSVHRCSMQTLMGQQAYILFYSRKTEETPSSLAMVESKMAQQFQQKMEQEQREKEGKNRSEAIRPNDDDIGEVVYAKKNLSSDVMASEVDEYVGNKILSRELKSKQNMDLVIEKESGKQKGPVEALDIRPIPSWHLCPMRFQGPLTRKFQRRLNTDVTPLPILYESFWEGGEHEGMLRKKAAREELSGSFEHKMNGDADSNSDSDSDEAASDSDSYNGEEVSSSESDVDSVEVKQDKKRYASLLKDVHASAAYQEMTSDSDSDSDSDEADWNEYDKYREANRKEKAGTLAAPVSNTKTTNTHPVDLKRKLIEDSRRGKDVGTEGFWDFGDNSKRSEEIKQKEMIAKSVLKHERSIANKTKLDEWDQTLDQGRMKKVKNNKQNEAEFKYNFFQDAANSLTVDGKQQHPDVLNNEKRFKTNKNKKYKMK